LIFMPRMGRRFFFRVGRSLAELHAAGLAAAARVNLCLHHHGGAELDGERLGLCGGGRNLTRRNRHAEPAQDFFCLILVEVHTNEGGRRRWKAGGGNGRSTASH
jgi:hypothetical protein